VKRALVTLVVMGLCTVSSQSALAQSNLGLKSAGGQLGLVSPENIGSTVGFGAFADLGTVAPSIHLAPHLDYWSKSESDFGVGKTTVSDMSLGVRAKYMFAVTSPKVRPFAGAGLGLHMLHVKVAIPDQNFGGTIIPGMTIEDSTTKFGLDVGGGLETPISPRSDLVAEMWYGIVDNVSQLSIKLGMGFKIGS